MLKATKDFTQEIHRYLKGNNLGPYQSTIYSLSKLKDLMTIFVGKYRDRDHVEDRDNEVFRRVKNKK